MVVFMEQKEKQEFLVMMRAEMRQIFGFFEERMSDKFKLVTERLDTIEEKLDKHTELFKDIYKKLDGKADVKEFDALESRVVKLERKVPRPSRSA